MNTSTFAKYIRAQTIAILFYLYTFSGLNTLNTLIPHRSGIIEGKTAILVIVYIVVSFLVATILFPIAMTQVTSAVTTSWNSSVSTTYVVLLPILVIIAIALHFLGMF